MVLTGSTTSEIKMLEWKQINHTHNLGIRMIRFTQFTLRTWATSKKLPKIFYDSQTIIENTLSQLFSPLQSHNSSFYRVCHFRTLVHFCDKPFRSVDCRSTCIFVMTNPFCFQLLWKTKWSHLIFQLVSNKLSLFSCLFPTRVCPFNHVVDFWSRFTDQLQVEQL